MIVADASALVEILVREPADELILRMNAEDLNCPHLMDVEVMHALRSLDLRGEITTAEARRAMTDLGRLPIDRHDHTGLRGRIWELRKNLSAYDAAYVALAESLDAPLVTVDARLARATGHRAAIESYDRS